MNIRNVRHKIWFYGQAKLYYNEYENRESINYRKVDNKHNAHT